MSKQLKKISAVICISALFPVAWAESGLRDPTQPPGAKVSSNTKSANIKLQAIFYNATKPSVMIGGEYYYEGDTFQGNIVVKINRGSIVLRGGRGEIQVSMYPSIRQNNKGRNDQKGD